MAEMTESERWGQAVRRLTELTKKGDLRWRRSSVHRPDLSGYAYTTRVDDRNVVIYEYRYRYFIDDERWENQSDVAIEFVSVDGQLEWRWPDTIYRADLLDAVRKQDVGADEFLKKFLGSGTSET